MAPNSKKTMMDINSQEQNLLGNQILPKSEDLCILAAILDSKWTPYCAVNRNYSAILATLQITSYALGV